MRIQLQGRVIGTNRLQIRRCYWQKPAGKLGWFYMQPHRHNSGRRFLFQSLHIGRPCSLQELLRDSRINHGGFSGGSR